MFLFNTMTRRAVLIALACGGIGAMVRDAWAVSLVLSTTSNLPALHVGQTVTFDVQLSGLMSGQELDYLCANVEYDKKLLGSPSVAQGAIVPYPLNDPFDFNTYEAEGVADATFSTFSNEPSYHITSNGVFLSFETRVLAAGAGTVGFTYVDGSEYVGGEHVFFTPNTGPALSFHAAEVPEPASGLTMATAVLVMCLFALWRSLFTEPAS
jgi:hypothetical protein